MEELLVDDGAVRNPSFTDYLIPTALDAPDVGHGLDRGTGAGRAVRRQGRRRAADDLVDPGRRRRHPRRDRARPHARAGAPALDVTGDMMRPATARSRISFPRLRAPARRAGRDRRHRRGGVAAGSPSPTPTRRVATSSSPGCGTSGCGSTSTASATSSAPGRRDRHDAAGDDRLATSTPSRTGGRYDGNLGVLAGLEVIETRRCRRHRDRAPAGGRRSSPTRRAAASRPTCSAASSTSGGLPLEEALDTVGRSTAPRLGDELERIGYAGPAAVPGLTAGTRTSSCTSSRARCSRPRASRSARSPGCRASPGRS